MVEQQLHIAEGHEGQSREEQHHQQHHVTAIFQQDAHVLHGKALLQGNARGGTIGLHQSNHNAQDPKDGQPHWHDEVAHLRNQLSGDETENAVAQGRNAPGHAVVVRILGKAFNDPGIQVGGHRHQAEAEDRIQYGHRQGDVSEGINQQTENHTAHQLQQKGFPVGTHFVRQASPDEGSREGGQQVKGLNQADAGAGHAGIQHQSHKVRVEGGEAGPVG